MTTEPLKIVVSQDVSSILDKPLATMTVAEYMAKEDDHNKSTKSFIC